MAGGTWWKALIPTGVGVVGIAVNILSVLVLVKHLRITRAKWCKYLINQSVIDTTVAVILLISHGNLVQGFGLEVIYTKGYFFSELLCKFWKNEMFFSMFSDASTFNLVIITLDRYLNLVHPFWYRKYITSTMTRVAIVSPWVLGPAYEMSLYWSLNHVGPNGTCEWSDASYEKSMATAYIYLSVTYLIPIFLMVFCYSHILYKVKISAAGIAGRSEGTNKPTSSTSEIRTKTSSISTESSTKNSSGISTVYSPTESCKTDVNKAVTFAANCNLSTTQNNLKHSKQNRTEQNIIRMLVCVAVGYFLCFTTHHVVIFLSIANVINGATNTAAMHAYDISYFLMFLNCMINPFIYVVQNDHLRKTAFSLFKCSK